jgi:hypothetical protein
MHGRQITMRAKSQNVGTLQVLLLILGLWQNIFTAAIASIGHKIS